MTAKWRVESVVKSAAELLADFERMEAEIAALKRPWGVLCEYEDVPLENMRVDVAKDYEWSRYETEYPKSREIVLRNLVACQANMALFKRLSDTITAIGIKTSVTDWSRRNPKSKDADWYALLKMAGPRHPTSVEEFDRRFNDRKRQREDHLKQQARADELAAQAREQEANEKRLLVRVVEVATAIGLDAAEATIDDVRSELRKRDKYLDLAVAGQQTRGDWSDGCYRVVAALGRFNVETPTDAEIVSEWSGQVSNFDDGRQFRDCKWCYDDLFALVKPEVMALWNKLS